MTSRMLEIDWVLQEALVVTQTEVDNVTWLEFEGVPLCGIVPADEWAPDFGMP